MDKADEGLTPQVFPGEFPGRTNVVTCICGASAIVPHGIIHRRGCMNKPEGGPDWTPRIFSGQKNVAKATAFITKSVHPYPRD